MEDVQMPSGTIEVGSRKQLFLDSRFIEASEGVTLTMNPPAKIGPVLLPDRPWERRGLDVWSSVLEADGIYKMWYSCTSRKDQSFLCHATSEDGEHWEKPSLGLIEFKGSKNNNIVIQNENSATVFLDPHASSDKRYKAVGFRWNVKGKTGIHIHTSPDGIHWKISQRRVFSFCCDTADQAIWDTRLKKYVAYIRKWNPLRKVGRLEMDDILEPWPFEPAEKTKYTVVPISENTKKRFAVVTTEAPTAFEYDDGDPIESDHYNPAAIKYEWAEDAYFIFPSAYLHFPEPPIGKYSNAGLLDIQMAVSRDGIKYHRLSRSPYIGLSPEGAKDSKTLYMAVGILREGNRLLQYYIGYDCTHGEPKGGKLRAGALCCAVQRLDGFVSADAAYRGGEIRTPKIQFKGRHLILNVDTSALGVVRVGILDEGGKEIPECSVDKCEAIHGNFIDHTVTWKGHSDLSSLTGKPIRLHFVMRSAKLYAFQFVG